MGKIITYNLTQDFIQNLAGFIEQDFLKAGKDISRLAIVFGGRRPALFLKRELAVRIKKGFLSPGFFSIDEFVGYILSKNGPFFNISDLDACFIIFNLAREIAPDILKGRESFSRFLPWAREILAFIEQLDLEDIKIGSLKNIQEKAAIGYDVPENINVLLASIISIRDAYHAALKSENKFSRGMMYLAASEYINNHDFSEFAEILFCGLFYLHKTEEKIIKYLYDIDKAVLLFQGGAGDWSVLEKIIGELSSPVQSQPEDPPRQNISMFSGFDVHSEACLVREVIKKIKKLDSTVIVLPKPDNIMALISEISAYAGDFNVSMGYPLKRSSLYSIFECVFRAQETKKDGEYYTRDYLKALSHPLVKNLRFFSNPSVTRVLVHKIEEMLLGMEEASLGGSIFIKLSDIYGSRELYDLALGTAKTMDIEVSRDELKDAVGKLHNLLFVCWEDIPDFHKFSQSLQDFLGVLVEKSFLGSYPLNLKMAEKVFSIAEELDSASFNKEQFPKEDIFKIFKNKLENEIISFSGSPLKGLQILGLFETRSLSFENVIVMDANESVMPSLKIYEPLIPREVMISLGLNRLEKEEEIQRYQFRRLISCAKNAYLVYQQRDDKEKSRFVEELIWERQKKENNLEVLSVPRASFKVRVLPKRLEIKKKADLIEYLKEYEYSASSLNVYLGCPLRFYYQFVLGLEEKEDLLEEPQGTDIGNFIHELLKETFGRFIGHKPYIDGDFRKAFFVALDNKFLDTFERKMKSDSFLIKEILYFRLGRFLDSEKGRGVGEIICLEKKFQSRIRLKNISIKFKAVIDRIDRLFDGSILVIDYKTGSVDMMPEANDEKIESFGFSREAIKKTVKSLQLPLYLYLVDNDKRFAGSVTNAALYSIKDVGKDSGLNLLFKTAEQLAGKDRIMSVYLAALESLIRDILDPEVPFRADEADTRQCQNCQFFYMCR